MLPMGLSLVIVVVLGACNRGNITTCPLHNELLLDRGGHVHPMTRVLQALHFAEFEVFPKPVAEQFYVCLALAALIVDV